jgi:hypothetical protein
MHPRKRDSSTIPKLLHQYTPEQKCQGRTNPIVSYRFGIEAGIESRVVFGVVFPGLRNFLIDSEGLCSDGARVSCKLNWIHTAFIRDSMLLVSIPNREKPGIDACGGLD